MKKYNLHIARSPLQLINIIEAIESLELLNNILIVIERKSQDNNSQIQKVLKSVDYRWEKSFYIQKTSNSNLLAYVKMIKELKKLSFSHMFTGDIDSISNVIVANLRPDKVFLVDDGTSTLKRHEALLQDEKLRFKDKVKLFRFNLFGLRSHTPYKINFFTFFDIHQKADEIIIKNEFKSLKKRFKLSASKSDKVYILGQPLYGKEISETTFIENLKRILDFYSAKEIIYLKHRYENPTDNIKALLNGRAEIVQNEYPIELDFLIKQEYPQYLTGFFSTALYTLKQMFSEAEVKAFYIPKNEFFNDERAEVVENYYDFFRENGFDIITDKVKEPLA